MNRTTESHSQAPESEGQNQQSTQQHSPNGGAPRRVA